MLTTVVLYDANGQLVLQQDRYEGGTSLRFASGDAVDFDRGASQPRVAIVLNGTSPASVIVFNVQADGSLVEDQTRTRIESALNTGYEASAAGLAAPDIPAPVKTSTSRVSACNCSQIGNAVSKAVQIFCDVLSAFRNGVKVELAEKVCIGANLVVDFVQAFRSDSSDALESRVFAALKLGITVICEGTKAAANLADYVANLTAPTSLFCLGVGLVDSGRTIYTGQSVSQELCNWLLTDQDPGAFRVRVSSVTLSIIDTAADDGDLIAIRHNGRQIFSGPVTNTARVLTVNRAPGFNQLEFEALNEGTTPSNTAQVTASGVSGSNFSPKSYSLSYGQVATFTIVRN